MMWRGDQAMPTWRMCAHLRNGVLVDIGSRDYVRLQRESYPIVDVEVTLTRDEKAATHWGWISADGDTPSMIWPTYDLYRTCFHTTPESEENAGQGRTVRLVVRPLGTRVGL